MPGWALRVGRLVGEEPRDVAAQRRLQLIAPPQFRRLGESTGNGLVNQKRRGVRVWLQPARKAPEGRPEPYDL